jgi:hypothetical protein
VELSVVLFEGEAFGCCIGALASVAWSERRPDRHPRSKDGLLDEECIRHDEVGDTEGQ